jgi:RNA polymerase sigma-70 factor (ECF subfamily)
LTEDSLESEPAHTENQHSRKKFAYGRGSHATILTAEWTREAIAEGGLGHNVIDWDQFVREHAERVVRIAMRILGNLDEAEDVSQEVFRGCLEVECEQGLRDPTAMAVRLATVRSLDRLRRRRTRFGRGAELRDGDRVTAIGPPEEAEARELADWLRCAIARLPRRQSEAFTLVAMEQTSRDEAAEILGTSVEAVSTALCEARKRLGEAFARRARGEDRRISGRSKQ